MAKVKYEYVIDDITGERGRRKLAHYNAWLGDPDREFGSIYPGFPEDWVEPVVETVVEEEMQEAPKVRSRKKGRKMEVLDQETVQTETKPKPAAKPVRQGTKLSVAVTIVKEAGKDDKEACLRALVEGLSITRGNASIYYTKALALLG